MKWKLSEHFIVTIFASICHVWDQLWWLVPGVAGAVLSTAQLWSDSRPVNTVTHSSPPWAQLGQAGTGTQELDQCHPWSRLIRYQWHVSDPPEQWWHDQVMLTMRLRPKHAQMCQASTTHSAAAAEIQTKQNIFSSSSQQHQQRLVCLHRHSRAQCSLIIIIMWWTPALVLKSCVEIDDNGVAAALFEHCIQTWAGVKWLCELRNILQTSQLMVFEGTAPLWRWFEVCFRADSQQSILDSCFVKCLGRNEFVCSLSKSIFCWVLMGPAPDNTMYKLSNKILTFHSS